ncbi:MAG TPA: phosphoribosyltransferase family protein [Rubricoccaceae bacterium]|nr:phosphoribosyltransferase family protein [Rubricoccaceae bacterium]
MAASPSALRTAARALAHAAASFVYPSLCLGCDARLHRDAGRLPLCPACLRRLPRAGAEAVHARLARFPIPSPFETAFALWTFDAGGTVQRLQHALKYHDRLTLGVVLGRLIGQAFVELRPGERYDAVIPVPLAKVRRLERGYNQSTQLALGMAEMLPGRPPVREELLRRARPTRSQTSLSRPRRWANVEGAFVAPDPTALSGRRALLVDDVLTTGATLTAAALPLRDAGAKVDLAVLALASD